MSNEIKKVLIVGDSITEGELGINYVEKLEAQFPQWIFRNMGLGGDTLQGIAARVLVELTDNVYDVVVVEAGHNDIILPKMKNLGKLYELGYERLLKRGSVPTTEADVFESKYAQMLTDIRRLHKGAIVVTTLSCLSEALKVDTNLKRAELNARIKKVGEAHPCVVADVGHAFDEVLKKGRGTDQFLDRFLNTFYFDALKTRTEEGAAALSRKRGLVLTVDGIHLNGAGAELYCSVLGACLKALDDHFADARKPS
ncbi:SGNH/GDSL hydrolase family protein [Fusibacter sp. JL298sf-3]